MWLSSNAESDVWLGLYKVHNDGSHVYSQAESDVFWDNIEYTTRTDLQLY